MPSRSQCRADCEEEQSNYRPSSTRAVLEVQVEKKSGCVALISVLERKKDVHFGASPRAHRGTVVVQAEDAGMSATASGMVTCVGGAENPWMEGWPALLCVYTRVA